MDVIVVPAPAQPQSNEGFYSINNQFQESGPKGFTEFKVLENGDLFWRIDLPGVQKDTVKVVIHPSKKSLIIGAYAPCLDIRDSDQRDYAIPITIDCSCCEISSFVSDLSDGVLRLVVSKTLITLDATCPYRFPNRSDPNDPALTGPVLQEHPWLKRGSTTAYEFTQIVQGSLYVRVDMPGVPEDSFTVSVMHDRVRVSGQAPALSHDSAGRFYSGDVALLSAPANLPISGISQIITKHGVIRLDIFPP